MRDVGASTVARIERRAEEDRDENAALRIVANTGHDNSDQERHRHDHRTDPDFTLENLPRNNEERQVKQSPQWTEHEASPPRPKALLQGGNREARPAPFFPDLYGNTNDQNLWQVHREEERPVLEKRHERSPARKDACKCKLDQGHAGEHEEVPAEPNPPEHIAP